MPAVITGASPNQHASRSALKGDSFITYQIRSQDSGPDDEGDGSSRRYSEFEALQSYLYRAYPQCVIPPIPSKENLTGTAGPVFMLIPAVDYLAKYITGKAESATQKVIQQRIRGLQIFLEFIDQHSVMAKDSAYQRFLLGPAEWLGEEVAPAAETSSALPTTAAMDSVLRKKVDSLEGHLETLEKSQAKILRGARESVAAYAELGSSFNGFSLENPALEQELDQAGQHFDKVRLDGIDLVASQNQLLETVQICQQFCFSIRRCMDNRREGPIEDEVRPALALIDRILAESLSAAGKAQKLFFSKASTGWSTVQAVE